MEHSKILPNLFLGSCPKTDGDIDQLKLDGITGLLNLQTEEDFIFLKLDWPRLRAAHLARSIEVRRVPILDFNWTDLEQRLPEAVDVLKDLLDDGHVVFVHCNVGLNRSPTTVVAYLHWFLGYSLEEAERFVRKHRPCDPAVGIIRRVDQDRKERFG